jgi:hypothetical protein
LFVESEALKLLESTPILQVLMTFNQMKRIRVCVCVREKKRERKRERKNERERERERRNERDERQTERERDRGRH